jgi:hypothetical protein
LLNFTAATILPTQDHQENTTVLSPIPTHHQQNHGTGYLKLKIHLRRRRPRSQQLIQEEKDNNK